MCHSVVDNVCVAEKESLAREKTEFQKLESERLDMISQLERQVATLSAANDSVNLEEKVDKIQK